MDGLLSIIALLALGYLLMIMELFVPGGVLGILGLAAVTYGCFLAFGLGPYWGGAAVASSLLVSAAAVVLAMRSRAARRLVLDNRPSREWKAPAADLVSLVGAEGVTSSPLRPAGIAELGERRLDVVTDSEFLEAGVRVRVREVEGSRIVVEPLTGSDEAPDERREAAPAAPEDGTRYAPAPSPTEGERGD